MTCIETRFKPLNYEADEEYIYTSEDEYILNRNEEQDPLFYDLVFKLVGEIDINEAINAFHFSHMHDHTTTKKNREYRAKLPEDSEYKKAIYTDIEIYNITRIINLISDKINNEPEYSKYKKHFLAPQKGSCVIGACLYAYKYPADNRKKKPDKGGLYTLGYINGEYEKEKQIELLNRIMNFININICFDSGRMD